MNKRIKKKRKLETVVVMLVAENAMQAEAIKNQNKEIMELKSIVQRNALATNEEFASVKAATLDNQAAITNIAIDVNYIKKNYKRKWGKKFLNEFDPFRNQSRSNTAFIVSKLC
ncbi:TPA: hypothetical protein ACQKU9_000741 [Streptococcus pyogenes]|nr:hypothetical protein [Streptococcus pyogenes]